MAKPTEVRLVAGLLDAEHESAEAAAVAILDALAEKRRKDDVWAGVAIIPIGESNFVRKGRGPWSTKRRAEKDAAQLAANMKGRPGSFFAVKLTLEEA